MSFYLKLLLPNFTKNTLFEKLPIETIEYIIKHFIFIPQFKCIINNYNFIIQNIKYRFYYIWKNYYNIILKLQIFNIQNNNINFKNIINKYIPDYEYIVNVLKFCNCCQCCNSKNLQINNLYNHKNNCFCQFIIRSIFNAKNISS